MPKKQKQKNGPQLNFRQLHNQALQELRKTTGQPDLAKAENDCTAAIQKLIMDDNDELDPGWQFMMKAFFLCTLTEIYIRQNRVSLAARFVDLAATMCLTLHWPAYADPSLKEWRTRCAAVQQLFVEIGRIDLALGFATARTQKCRDVSAWLASELENTGAASLTGAKDFIADAVSESEQSVLQIRIDEQKNDVVYGEFHELLFWAC